MWRVEDDVWDTWNSVKRVYFGAERWAAFARRGHWPDADMLLLGHIGRIKEVEGWYIAAGFSGTGFKISPAIGLVMSELLLDGTGQTIDISAFRPSCFAEGKPVKGQFEYKDD